MQTMPKQDQVVILNRIYTALGTLKIEGTQSELLAEVRKGVAIVNNAINAELQLEVDANSTNGASPNGQAAEA